MIHFLAFIYRVLLSLRYRVHLEGTEVLKGSETKLFLSNHQAIVDPQILCAHLLRYTMVSPLVSANYTDIGVFKPIFKMMGVVSVPDLERGREGVEVVIGLHSVVNEALKTDRNILIYPGGQLAGQGYERIYNKQSAWQVCKELPPEVRVIGVRIRGLWGSIWSRAWSGRSPNFLVTYLKGVFYVFANLILFLPRRDVILSFCDITEDALKRAEEGRNSFNEYLEEYYNALGEEPVLFLKHFFYFPKSRRKLPDKIQGADTAI